jgi:hypothetical protein
MPVPAETPATLAMRLDEAIRQVEAAREGGTPLADPGPLFPETEEVTWSEGTLRIDHASLRAEWRAVPTEGESRRQALERLRNRLAAVRDQVNAAADWTAVTTSPPAGWREKLAEVMSRPELRKQQAQEPLLSRFIRWLRDKLALLLPRGTRRTVGSIASWIIYTLASLALVLVLFVLARTALPLFSRDRREAPQAGVPARPKPETPESLLSLAETRARAGDLRGAAQAIFRWMLLSLHRAGRLEYDPALTNREHLTRLKADAEIRTAFEKLSRQFERVWYGLQPVPPEEYATFRDECQQVAGGRA